jgi:uncharacterized protein (UPF0332 family)
MTCALLNRNNHTTQTHSGIIHLFGLHFIRTQLVSKDAGKIYSKLYEIRQTGDYDDLFNLSEEDVLPLIPLAGNFINELDALLAIRK